MAEQWLSIVEYARKFAISDMTIRRRIRTGRLHAVLKDGKYYIPVADDIQASGSRPSQSEPRRAAEAKPVIRPAQAPAAELPPPAIGSEFDRYEVTGTRMSPSPGVQRTTVGRASAPASQLERAARDEAVGTGLVPASLRLGLEESPTSLVESKALLDFCESVLRRFSNLELRVEESYKAKLSLMEVQLAAREQEINKLRQQIEDLQLLIKVLEKR